MTKNLKEVTKLRARSIERRSDIKLILGQLAFEVEKAIVSEVFTKVIGSPVLLYNIATIADMQKALMRQENFADVLADDSKHKEATEKWKGLQKTLDWKDYHF